MTVSLDGVALTPQDRLDRCRNEEHTRQRPELKTGHFYLGRKKTFLNWVDSPLR